MRLIETLAKQFGYEKIKPVAPVVEVPIKREVQKLFDALKEAGYKAQGSTHTQHSKMFLFVNTDKSLMVDLSKTERYIGEFLGCYSYINEVNIDSLIVKLTAKNESLEAAKESLNEALRIVIENKVDKTEIPSPLDNALREVGSHLNNLE